MMLILYITIQDSGKDDLFVTMNRVQYNGCSHRQVFNWRVL